SYVFFKDIDLKKAKDSVANLGYAGLLYIPMENDLESVADHSFFYTKDSPNSSVLDKLERVFQDRLRMGKLQELGISSKEFAEMDRSCELRTASFKVQDSLREVSEIKA